MSDRPEPEELRASPGTADGDAEGHAAMATETEDSPHLVTWTVHIALAIPRGKDVEIPAACSDKTSKKKVPHEVVRPQAFYHVEYTLPGASDAVKVDVIVFGPVAKLYKEDEVKVVIPQHEGNWTWISWTQTFTIRVERHTVIRLLAQKIKLQIWNSKNKLSSRAWATRFATMRHAQSEDTTACAALIRDRKLTRKDKPPMDELDLKNLKRDGTASAEISHTPLLAGEMTVTECFSLYTAGVCEAICKVCLDKPFISEALKVQLNPLVITILSATSMPSSPVPFHVLQESCLPVYCQYKLLHLQTHRTKYQSHGSTVLFNDVNVVLAGLMSSVDLLEMLTGPPLEIEVHDRDRKLSDPPKTPAMSEDLGDTLDIPSGARQLFKRKTNGVNSYGVASINLSELLNGKTSLKMDLRIRSSPPPLTLDRKRRKASCGTSMGPVQQGHYFDSKLKVKIEISRPLNLQSHMAASPLSDCPFGRIVYIFPYANVSMVARLRLEVRRINAEALNLTCHSEEMMEGVLQLYRMNSKQRTSKDLDYVSGVHVLDKKVHIFVLEGLKDKAVRRLWENVPPKQSPREDELVTVLYNSSLSFLKRLYDSLGVGLTSFCLRDPLETILRQPEVYVRHLVPSSCFQALSRLNHLREVKNLKDVLLHDLLPTADMVLSMHQQYGAAPEDITDQVVPEEEAHTCLPSPKEHVRLDSHNVAYTQWKRDQQKTKIPAKDFVRNNIRSVQDASERMLKRDLLLLVEHSPDKPVHNYSCQTFNTTQKAKELLLKELQKVPGRRFTYSQQYQSATVEQPDVVRTTSTFKPSALKPGTGEDFKIDERPPSRKRHDEAGQEELKKLWKEKVLEASTPKPKLPRDHWSKLARNFRISSKPDAVPSPAPVPVPPPAHQVRQEQEAAARAIIRRWLGKVASTNPASPDFKCPVLEQPEESENILKEEPKKIWLRRAGKLRQPASHLSVLRFGEEEAGESKKDRKSETASRKDTHYSKAKGDAYRYKRTALPLNEQERKMLAFQGSSPIQEAQTPAVRPQKKIVELRTHKDMAWYAQ